MSVLRLPADPAPFMGTHSASSALACRHSYLYPGGEGWILAGLPPPSTQQPLQGLKETTQGQGGP